MDRLHPADPILLAAYERPPGQLLRDLPPVAPLPQQQKLAAEVIRLARVSVTFELRWVAPPRDAGYARGETVLDTNGLIFVSLDATLHPNDIVSAFAHELGHVADYAVGLHRQLDRVALEQRADAFRDALMGRIRQ